MSRLDSIISGKQKSCGCVRPEGKPSQFSGVGEMSGEYWRRVFWRCKKSKKNLECTISKEEAYQIYLKQNNTCALSGLPISFKDKSASIDRIDSNKGYIQGNIQWVHKDINVIKLDYSEEEFFHLIKTIYEFKGLGNTE